MTPTEGPNGGSTTRGSQLGMIMASGHYKRRRYNPSQGSGVESLCRRKMRTTRLIAASGVTGLLLILMPSFSAHAGLWCPTPIPGVPIRTCLCESITGRAEVSSPTPLSPLTLFGLWRDLNATAMVDWVGRVQVREGRRRFLSHRWLLACDRERDCTTTRTVAGGSVVYKYACYAKARPGPCGQRFC